MRIFAFFLLIASTLQALPFPLHFTNDPIDVVIPSTDKDLETLDLCIAGIRENCPKIRRVIVISAKPMTDQAEWFNEADYPFSIKDVEEQLHFEKTFTKAEIEKNKERTGWYFQQLLKLYAAFVIPGISSNVLVLDSDTIFLKPVRFLNKRSAGLYNPGIEYHPQYFDHAARLLPGLDRVHNQLFGICHHMLFQKCVLKNLMAEVEALHKVPFWQAFCRCVAPEHTAGAGASEYEIYFSYVFSRTNLVEVRFLNWVDKADLSLLDRYKENGCHYAACHAYMRSKDE